MKIYFYFFFPTLCFLYSPGRLVFLYTHFRHGTRGPLELNDNYQDILGEKWTGLGELTGVGERMHYLLGLRNRKKYIKQEGFLSQKFDPHQMLIFTSDTNRTMISCYAQLQGLYPQRANLGEILTAQQEEDAYPPILNELVEKDPDIEKAIKELNYSALPYRMTLVPSRMINKNEIRISILDREECTEKVDKIIKNNEEIKEFKEVIDKFNKNNALKLNEYFNKEKAEFNMNNIENICDNFLSNLFEKRKMQEFKDKTDIDFYELKEDCLYFFKMFYIYIYHGDKEKIISHVESSKNLREILYYMKRRLDADISEINEDSNYKDYSRPRWIMISGHDSTVSANLVLLIKALGLDMATKFQVPKYASQLALEVRRNSEKGQSYSDYYIVGYFDNNELFNMKVDEFINKMEKEIWTDQQIDEYCGFSNVDKTKNVYKTLMIVFICLCAAFLVSTIILGVLLYKSKHSDSNTISQKFDIGTDSV